MGKVGSRRQRECLRCCISFQHHLFPFNSLFQFSLHGCTSDTPSSSAAHHSPHHPIPSPGEREAQLNPQLCCRSLQVHPSGAFCTAPFSPPSTAALPVPAERKPRSLSTCRAILLALSKPSVLYNYPSYHARRGGKHTGQTGI